MPRYILFASLVATFEKNSLAAVSTVQLGRVEELSEQRPGALSDEHLALECGAKLTEKKAVGRDLDSARCATAKSVAGFGCTRL